MKRLLSLSAFLLIAIAAMAHDFVVDGIYYKITSSSSSDNPTVEVTFEGKYYYSYDNEYTGAVSIPESVTYGSTTYSVTSIGSSAFYDCTGLTSIEIPNRVTSIGKSAFSDCPGLTSVTLPNSLITIGEYNQEIKGETNVEIIPVIA